MTKSTEECVNCHISRIVVGNLDDEDNEVPKEHKCRISQHCILSNLQHLLDREYRVDVLCKVIYALRE